VLSRRAVATLVALATLVAVAGVAAALLRGGGEAAEPAATRSREAERQATVIAYVPYWDQQRGFASLRRNLDLVDEVSPFWYSLDRRGRVVLADDEHTTVDRSTVRFLQRRGIRVLPTVTNLRNGDWAPELVSGMLHDPAAVDRHVRALTALAVDEGYDGIDLDYEDLRAADREAYSAFLRRLAGALHAADKLLTTSVHPKVSDAGYDERNRAQDYRAIGAAVDQVRVMTYDYSWETSPPGPVAPAGWVEDVIAWTVTQVPPEKVVLGAVLLGYDWVAGRGETVDHGQAVALARRHGAEIARDRDRAPWFRYQDAAGRRHEVWWEDAESVAVKLRLVARYGLGGAFFWNLGGEDPAVWPVARATLTTD
jgi:spore germination protein